MKLLLCFFMLSMLNVSGSIFSQNATFDLAIKGKTVKEIFKDIESRSDIRFLYNDNFDGLNRIVSINAEDQTINSVLGELLAGVNLTYRELENNLIVITPLESFLQQNTVTGRVTDADTGEPLPGVSIVIRGTTIGTITNVEGAYTLTNVPPDAILVFSFIGMISQDIAVEGRDEINIVMRADVLGIEEVVAVGYGYQRRSEVTGSVSVVRRGEIQDYSSFNALQSLRGKVAGVNIFTNSGAPTGKNRVIIRGTGTVNTSTDPLYVVDGVIVENIHLMNPNDVIGIEVLKDASAAAIYGSRGANGVILITTERGGTEGTVVRYTTTQSIGRLRGRMDVLNSEEFMEMIRIGFENAPLFRNYAPGTEPVFPNLSNDPRLWDALGNPIYDTDWQKESTRTAYSHDHQLSIQTGSDGSSFGAFMNYTDRQGILLNSWMKRINLKMVYDVKPREWLSAGTIITANRISENDITEDFGNPGGPNAGALKNVVAFAPIFPVTWEDGTYTNHTQQQTIPRLDGHSNPVFQLMESDRLRDRTQLHGNAYIAFQMHPNLEFRSQLGIDNTIGKNRDYNPMDMPGGGAPLGLASISDFNVLYWQNENYFTYLNEIGQHRFNGVLGASWQKRESQGNTLTARGFEDNFFRYNSIGTATDQRPSSSYINEWSIASYFSRITYTFRNTYSLTFSGRVDGSSRVGYNSRYGFFPSGGISWIVSNEDFMEGLNFIDLLRLRSSYGVVGNTEIGLYQSLATVGSGTTYIGGQRVPSSWVQRMANRDLRWERTTQFNIGGELSLFNQRVSVEADYYYKLTDDLLLARPIPVSSGFSSILDNIGSVSNRGFEVLLTTRNVSGRDFSWYTTLSLSHNKNRVEQLGAEDEDIFPGPRFFGTSNTIIRVGEPLGSFWGFENLGTYSTEEAEEAALVGKIPGMIKRSEDRTIIGKGFPDWTGSFINRFSYRNFDVTLDFQFVYGVDIYQHYFHIMGERMGIEPMFRSVFYNSWTPDNQNTIWPQIRHLRLSGADSQPHSGWVVDGSYIRANLISIGYTVSPNILESVGFSTLRLTAGLENAFVIHHPDFEGFDPESTTYAGLRHTQNIFNFQYPKPRTFSLGVDVRF